MSRIIPNQNSWIGFTSTAITDLGSIPLATITGAKDLTPWTVSLNASSTGNTVPTPSLDSLFETSVPGTSAATFTADFYRDDEDDEAWETLPRGTRGHFIISRYKPLIQPGDPTTPETGDSIEVWPVYVVSRTMAPLSSNTALMFTMTASVPKEPEEDATVA